MADTEKLRKYREDLADDSKRLIICRGLPVTGKTYAAVTTALKIICRPESPFNKLIIVVANKNHGLGYLPGKLDEKLSLYTRQIKEYIECSNGKKGAGGKVKAMLNEGKLELLPLKALQGDRFHDSFVILDEAENCSWEMTYAFLTRTAENTKFVITGDTSLGQKNEHICEGGTIIDYCIDKFGSKPYAAVHSFYEDSDILCTGIPKDIILTLLPDFL